MLCFYIDENCFLYNTITRKVRNVNVTNNIIYEKSKNKQNAFKGRYRPVINFFKKDGVNNSFEKLEDPTMKLLFINCTSLIAPSIIVDSFRNKYAGAETAFYQLFNSVVNYFVAGLIALGVAAGFNSILNPSKVNTMGWVSNKSVDFLKEQYEHNKTLAQFAQNILEKASASHEFQNVNLNDIARAGKVNLPEISTQIFNPENHKNIVEILGKHLGTVDNITVAAKQGKFYETSLPQLVKDLNYLGKEFKKASSPSTLDKIASRIKNTNRMKTIASIGIVATLGFFSQFINNWITKKRTGKSGFVGYKEFGQNVDKNTHSKENNKNNTTSFKGIIELPSLESKKFMPTYEQLKWVIYPAGVVGKNLFCRSDDERREVLLKTSFAFLNFLVIPSFIDNLMAYSYKNKHLFNNINNDNKKLFLNNKNAGFLEKTVNFFKNLPLMNKLEIRSYKDIEAYSHYVAQDLENKPLNKQILAEYIKNPSEELIRKINRLNGSEKTKELALAIQKELKGIKNVSKFASIAYSLLTLGIGINVINIIITNKKHKKFLKHKKELENQKNYDINDVFKLELIKDPKFKNLYSEFLISNNK